MKIGELYVYPIKSLRGCSLPHATLTQYGFPHDRRFLLFKEDPDGSIKHLAVSSYPQMCLFTTELDMDRREIRVTFTDPKTETTAALEVPLEPDTEDLEEFEMNMHQSKTTGLIMDERYSSWFSECFGFRVRLAYLGRNRRAVLGNIAPGAAARNALRRQQKNSKDNSWYSNVFRLIPGMAGVAPDDEEDYEIGFADLAAYLVASRTSLNQISSRLPDGEEPFDITKFRPNIIIDDAEEPFEEDYWAALRIGNQDEEASPNEQGPLLLLTANCVRCASINVDYATGAFGKGPAGQMLKKLQSDRRVDGGVKYSPVFGRYAFLARGSRQAHQLDIRVGDTVEIEKRNDYRTSLLYPGLGRTPKDDLFPVEQ